MMKFMTLALLLIAVAHCSVRPAKPVNIAAIKAVYSKDWFSGYLDL